MGAVGPFLKRVRRESRATKKSPFTSFLGFLERFNRIETVKSVASVTVWQKALFVCGETAVCRVSGISTNIGRFAAVWVHTQPATRDIIAEKRENVKRRRTIFSQSFVISFFIFQFSKILLILSCSFVFFCVLSCSFVIFSFLGEAKHCPYDCFTKTAGSRCHGSAVVLREGRRSHLFNFFLRGCGRLSQVLFIEAVKRGIVVKSACLACLDGTGSPGDHFLRDNEPFGENITVD